MSNNNSNQKNKKKKHVYMKIARFISQVTSYDSLKCTKKQKLLWLWLFFFKLFSKSFLGGLRMTQIV